MADGISVIVVDDCDAKAEKVESCIRSFVAKEHLTLVRVRDLAAARVELGHRCFDLLILDLNIPLRAGEAPRADAGTLLLEEIQRTRKGLLVPRHVVGLSEFPELISTYRQQFEGKLWHVVQYDGASDDWANRLGQKLVHIAESEFSLDSDGYHYDLAVVTALEAVELEAVLTLPGKWRERTWEGDSTIFRIGEFSRRGRRLKIVAATSGQMGIAAATALSMKMIERFRPRVLAMVGIAAGVKGTFGDILVADQCWDYGSGKISADGSGASQTFSPAPMAIPIHGLLRAKVSHFAMDGAMPARIRKSWTGPAPKTPPTIRIGPLASGASVVADRGVVERIRAHNRKLVGVEMEAYGVFLAAQQCKEPRPMTLVAKSICDFADSTKGDKYQAYAAHTSARFLYEFALAELLAQDGHDGLVGVARTRTRN